MNRDNGSEVDYDDVDSGHRLNEFRARDEEGESRDESQGKRRLAKRGMRDSQQKPGEKTEQRPVDEQRERNK